MDSASGDTLNFPNIGKLSLLVTKLISYKFLFGILQSEKKEGIDAADVFARALQDSTGPAVAAAASGMSSPRYRSSQPGSPKTAGDFFELLTSSDFYKNTKV